MGESKLSDTITTFYHPTKLRCPNVKILGSNMVSRNLDNGSKNMEKKIHKHIVLKKKIYMKSKSNYEREIHIKGTLTP